MSAQGLETIDNAAHTTHEWIGELAGRLDWTSKRNTLRLLRVTMHQIRDHLHVNEMAQFSAQLPLLIRGMFFEGWVPKQTPNKERHIEEFVHAIEEHVGNVEEYRGPEDITHVFHLLNAHVSEGEISDVRSNLPRDIRDFWPRP